MEKIQEQLIYAKRSVIKYISSFLSFEAKKLKGTKLIKSKKGVLVCSVFIFFDPFFVAAK